MVVDRSVRRRRRLHLTAGSDIHDCVSDTQLRLPQAPVVGPIRAILRRFALAGLIVGVNWLLVVLERGQYQDNLDGHVSLVDALYYTTVTLSTTGYGDITPVTESARLVNALVVTPMRVLFVIILVGTTIQALTEKSRLQIRQARWRARMAGHTVVLGYGTKGRNAVRALLLRGVRKDRIVVVDDDHHAARDASSDGLVVVTGAATRRDVLEEALISRADVVIVALDRDDTAILATLTVRRLAPDARIIAATRESQNAELLQQSGADSVVVSSETAGRLLGLAADSPDAVEVVEDLLAFGHGLDLVDRPAAADELGRHVAELPVPVVAVVRDGRRLDYADPGIGTLAPGDRILYVQRAPTP